MIYFYRIIFSILKVIVLLLKPFLNSKMKKWVQLREAGPTLKNSLKKSFWFHASSGEIEYVKSVILEIKKRNPAANIVVTYSSPSAEKLFENIKPYVTEFKALPWDQPTALKKLITSIDPQVLIFSRTDFWPELIWQTQQQQIPTCIVSYFGQMSFSRQILAKWLFKKINFISCVESLTANKLKSLLPSRVHISADGDTRFDQVFWRLEQKSKVNLQPTRPIFICGSTWSEDEDQLGHVFTQLLKNNYQIIWSPHEVGAANIQRIVQKIKMSARSYQLLSRENKDDLCFTADFLVVDQIGYLADLYRYAEIAFVGGSFKEKVHSVMEPLCCGLPVLVGPYFKNNPEAIKYVTNSHPKVLYVAKDTAELWQGIEQIRSARDNFKENIRNLMKVNQHSTKKIVDTIQDNVLKS
ncbi:MAG: hypothetical protein H7328_11240 [Bdellovibrio sp.]|nr:hypothetical protein [Bdellovibrio sp.]